MTTDLLNNLILATRWEHIYRGEESYVIKVDFKDRKRVHGLTSNGSNFYLGLPEFKDVPIAIYMVDTYGVAHEYWTVGENMHRPSGRPSYISINSDTGWFKRLYHWNGVVHRDHGPASETGYMFKDSRADENGPYVSDPAYRVRRFKLLKQEWIQHGSPRGAYDGICSVEYENYTEIINSAGGIESPKDQVPALSASKATFSWDHRVEPPLGLYPKLLHALNFHEYIKGSFYGRTMASPSIEWSAGYERYDDYVQCTDWSIANFDKQLSLGDGRFWSIQDEYIAITQFDKLINVSDPA